MVQWQVKEAQGADDLVATGPRIPSGDQVNLKSADVFQAQPLGRLAEISAELRDRADVRSLRRRRHVADRHVLDHAAAGTHPHSIENIDFAVLADLSDADLRELGIGSLGHRKRLLAAIEARSGAPPSAGASGSPGLCDLGSALRGLDYARSTS